MDSSEKAGGSGQSIRETFWGPAVVQGEKWWLARSAGMIGAFLGLAGFSKVLSPGYRIVPIHGMLEEMRGDVGDAKSLK